MVIFYHLLRKYTGRKIKVENIELHSTQLFKYLFSRSWQCHPLVLTGLQTGRCLFLFLL